MRLWDKAAGGKSGDPTGRIGRFTVGEDPQVDLEWAWHDVIGSAAHVRVQVAAGLLSDEEAEILLGGLQEILSEIEAGNFGIAVEEEDVHTAVEVRLTARLGAIAGKLHTGRSRNDQVLTDLRLWLKEQLSAAEEEWLQLAAALLDLAERGGEQPLSGYTHHQPAMPSSYALWAAGFAGALLDLLPTLSAAQRVVDRSPLGSAAGYGTPLPLDRQLTASLLGFSSVEEPVTACQLTRGLVESAALSALGAAAQVVARFAADVVLFSSSEFSAIHLSDALTTGSSIMPQKRNPDVAELLRANVHRVRASCREIEDLTVLPSGYHRDVQSSKGPLVRGMAAARDALVLGRLLAEGVTATPKPLDAALFATAEAFRRATTAGRPFREVYREVGLEVQTGQFVPAERAAAPTVDLAALRFRLPAPAGVDWRARWRQIL